jgi:hypothetical protein
MCICLGTHVYKPVCEYILSVTLSTLHLNRNWVRICEALRAMPATNLDLCLGLSVPINTQRSPKLCKVAPSPSLHSYYFSSLCLDTNDKSPVDTQGSWPPASQNVLTADQEEYGPPCLANRQFLGLACHIGSSAKCFSVCFFYTPLQPSRSSPNSTVFLPVDNK